MFVELQEKKGRNEGEGRKHLVNLENVSYFREGQDGVTVIFGNQLPGLTVVDSYAEIGRLIERHVGRKVAGV